MTEAGICKEHSKIEALLNNSIELLQGQKQCLTRLLERMVKQEELLEQYLKYTSDMETRLTNAINRIETTTNRKIEGLEKRIDKTEQVLDKMDGAVGLLKISISILAASGIVGVIFSFIRG